MIQNMAVAAPRIVANYADENDPNLNQLSYGHLLIGLDVSFRSCMDVFYLQVKNWRGV